MISALGKDSLPRIPYNTRETTSITVAKLMLTRDGVKQEPAICGEVAGKLQVTRARPAKKL
jgi:hypothetical protein